MPIRIALTSIPPRFAGLGPVLESLTAQGADEVMLSLPWQYDRFPNWDGSVPPLPGGVTLVRGRDFGAATKFTLTAARWPNDRMVICDDDCIYGPGWLEGLRGPGVVAGSVFDGGRIGAPGAVIVQGFAGVSFVPGDIGPALSDIPKDCWLVDDIWLSGTIAAAGVEVVASPSARAAVTALDTEHGLQDITDRAGLNQAAVGIVRDRLGVWI